MIEKIKELRQKTSLGMNDCKRALDATGYDIEKAIKYLTEQGNRISFIF